MSETNFKAAPELTLGMCLHPTDKDLSDMINNRRTEATTSGALIELEYSAPTVNGRLELNPVSFRLKDIDLCAKYSQSDITCVATFSLFDPAKQQYSCERWLDDVAVTLSLQFAQYGDACPESLTDYTTNDQILAQSHANSTSTFGSAKLAIRIPPGSFTPVEAGDLGACLLRLIEHSSPPDRIPMSISADRTTAHSYLLPATDDLKLTKAWATTSGATIINLTTGHQYPRNPSREAKPLFLRVSCTLPKNLWRE